MENNKPMFEVPKLFSLDGLEVTQDKLIATRTSKSDPSSLNDMISNICLSGHSGC